MAIRWIDDHYNAEVITVTVDVGQADDLQAIEKKAKLIGALRHYSIDAKREFAEDYVFPAIKANALYQSKYPVSTALARPLIASKLVEIAKKENAMGVAHGCTGKGNDQVRFDVTIKSLHPKLKIIAPIREWKLTRDEEIKYAQKNDIPVPVGLSNPYSVDQNLWGRSIECGILEKPEFEPPPEVYEWTNAPEKAPEAPEYVSIDFDSGVPVSVNGRRYDAVKLIKTLNFLGGKHAVGRIDHIEDRLVGIKSREVYECPGATILIEAHRDLEKSVLTRHELLFKLQADQQWTLLVYDGLWSDPLKDDLDAFMEHTQQRVTGKVKLKLYKGSAQVVGRSSPMSLYDNSLATYDVGSTFDQAWSNGFIEIWSMPTVVANATKRKAVSRVIAKPIPRANNHHRPRNK